MPEPRSSFFATPKRHPPGHRTPVYRRGGHVELFLVTDGRGTFRCLDTRLRVRPQTIVVLAPDADHSWAADRSAGLSYDYLSIREWSPARLDEILEGNACRMFRLGGEGYAAFREFYARLLVEWEERDDRTPALAKHLIGAILILIDRAREGRSRTVRFSEPVRRARVYLREHWQERPSAETVARVAGVSPGRLRARFREETGSSPRGFVLEQKLLAAKDLLLTTDLPLKAISERLGFSTVHPFTTFFHQRAGCPPGAWREREGA